MNSFNCNQRFWVKKGGGEVIARREGEGENRVRGD
jgi:hypothetical protein